MNELPPVWTSERLTDKFDALQRDIMHLETAVGNFGSTPIELAKLTVQVTSVSEKVSGLRLEVQAMAAAIARRDEVMIQERGQNRRALWALVGVLLVALIGGIFTLMAAGVL